MRTTLRIYGLLALAALAPAAVAQDNTWTNTSNDYKWNATSTNWTSPTTWNTNGTALFTSTGAGTITVDSLITLKAIDFQFGGYTIDGSNSLKFVNSGTGSLSGGQIQVVSAGSATINATVAGTVGLTKLGGGALTLGGTNTYTGSTTITSGTLAVSSDANLGAASGTVTMNGGLLQINGTSFTTTTRPFDLGAGGGNLLIFDPTNTFTLSTIVQGGGRFTKSGAGTLVLEGANAYNGTTIEGGVLSVSNNAHLGNTGSGVAVGVALNNGGTLRITGTTFTTTARLFTLGSSGPGGTIDISSSANTFTLTNNVTSSSGGLTKVGAGTLVLAGTNNDYTGSTTVSAGTLTVTGTLATATNGVQVNPGGTLSGTGTINRSVTVSSGGTLEGGSGGIGTLLINNSVTVNSGGTLRAELGVGTGTGAADLLNLSGGSGALVLASGAKLNLSANGFGPTGATTYTLANLNGSGMTFGGITVGSGQTIAVFTSTGGNTGTVAIDPAFSGSTLTFDLTGFTTLNSDDRFTLQRSGNNLVLQFQPVPEPATVLAVGAAGLAAASWVRRRRSKTQGG